MGTCSKLGPVSEGKQQKEGVDYEACTNTCRGLAFVHWLLPPLRWIGIFSTSTQNKHSVQSGLQGHGIMRLLQGCGEMSHAIFYMA